MIILSQKKRLKISIKDFIVCVSPLVGLLILVWISVIGVTYLDNLPLRDAKRILETLHKNQNTVGLLCDNYFIKTKDLSLLLIKEDRLVVTSKFPFVRSRVTSVPYVYMYNGKLIPIQKCTIITGSWKKLLVQSN